MFFKSKEGKEKIRTLYNQKLQELNIEYTETIVLTKFGATNVIITGSSKNPPLLLIHGTGGCAPQILESFPNLASKYCVYAIDVLAQPNKSAENRLDMKSLDYGKWNYVCNCDLSFWDLLLEKSSKTELIVHSNFLCNGFQFLNTNL